MRRRGLVALAALALAGCGGASFSSEELSHRAEAICSRTNRALDRLRSPPVGPETSAFLIRGSTQLGSELRQLRKLHPVGEALVVYRDALAALTAQLGALRGAAAAIKQGADPTTEFATLQRVLGPLETRADNAWSALQIPACLER